MSPFDYFDEDTNNNILSNEKYWYEKENNWIEIEDDTEIIQTKVEEALKQYAEGLTPGIAVDEE